MPEHEPSGEAPDVNVSGGQGIQVGSGNTQYNLAPKQPLDPVALSGLNPNIAVARLQQLSHDELVYFFVKARPRNVAEIIEVFSEVDLVKFVATLGDIGHRKATELISPVGKDKILSILRDLPEAAEAIARTARRLGWVDAEPLELCLPDWYIRKHNNGRIFWSQPFGVLSTTGEIDDYLTKSDIGWNPPMEDQETARTSPYATTGVRQKCMLGTVYSSNCAFRRPVRRARRLPPVILLLPERRGCGTRSTFE